MSTLAMGGKLYPEDMKIEVRGASVAEIRTWSNLDENDPMSIASHTLAMLTACVRVTGEGGKSYSVKDIYEHDKLALLLTIHIITFADKADRMLYIKGRCSNTLCNAEFDKLAVTPANLSYQAPDASYDKYIDRQNGQYVLQTKSFGSVEYKPTTIGLGQAMFSWIQSFAPEFIKDNQEMLKTVQAFVTDWRLANDKSLRKLQIERYNTMTAEQIGFYTALLAKFTIAVSDTLEYVCPHCGASFHSQLAIEGGYKGMFVPVQSLDDELL